MKIMEKALKELRIIRHEYNNIFQNIVFYIENGQRDLDLEIVDEIMTKASELNKNNILQLVKLKKRKTREMASKFIDICRENNIKLDLMVEEDFDQANISESILCNVVDLVFRETLKKELESNQKELIIEFCSESQGALITFESSLCAEEEIEKANEEIAVLNSEIISQKTNLRKILEINKNVIFNFYNRNSRLIQEIMIMQ